jgi:WD40 repeat protein
MSHLVPGGARILTAGADKTARLWDAASSKLIFSFDQDDGVNTATFSLVPRVLGSSGQAMTEPPDGAQILTDSELRQNRQALECNFG